MRKLIALLLLCIIQSCTNQNQSDKGIPEGSLDERIAFIKNQANFSSEEDRLEALFDTYTEYLLSSSPINATFYGKPGYDHLWDDLSPEGLQKNTEELGLFYQLLESFDPMTLSPDDQLNFSILSRTIKDNYELFSQFPEQYLIIDQVQGIHQAIAQVIQIMPNDNNESIENILSRLNGIPVLMQQLQTTLQEGIDRGIVMPKTSVIKIPDQLKGIISENPEQSVFYIPFTSLPEEINQEGGSSIQERARKIITEKVNPAFKNFTVFFEEVYLPHTRDSYGLNELPNGEAWYNKRIQHQTTTNLTADQIHQIGKLEVNRIKEEMLDIIDQLGFEGDLDDFNKFLKTDPRFYFDSPEELVMTYRDICKRIDPMLPKLFGKLPRLPYGVKVVPEYQEQATTTAYYMPGAADNGIAGNFYVNTYNLPSRPKWGMEALAIHEAVPGHHLQIALAQEQENVPEFRTMIMFTAFVEGWGLYSESLGKDLGMYQDLYSRYGQLTFEIWRAIRLVVDTGIHQLGWSRQDAITYFQEHSSMTDQDVIVEVDRYIAWPGQALAYKIGELKIKELRKIAEEELGEDFDVRAFHDVVLGSGSVPLDVLEQNVNQWIDAIRQ
ncbi:MAG: DUF885 domain-containing protein [Cyclobacteriaceae bacterium]|nr:DUF885 domain-containing protein [Cyclobacteriaceae bacterium SS2]